MAEFERGRSCFYTNDVALQNQRIQAAKAGVLLGFDYFEKKFFANNAPLKPCMQFFKARAHPEPTKIPSSWGISGGRSENLLGERTAIIAEKAAYQNLCRDLDDFWRQAVTIPCFQKMAYQVMLVQPSSAVVERVFSILRTHLDDKQHKTLEDTLEATLMLNVNELSRLNLPPPARERLRAHVERVEHWLRSAARI